MKHADDSATEDKNPRPRRPWITARDVDLLRAIMEYRVLLRDQLQALFFHETATGELIKNSRRVANRRLEKLVADGYLSATAIPPDPRLNARNTQYTYSLDHQGALLLAEEGVMSADELKRYRDRNKVTPRYTLHLQAINDFRISLTLAALARGDEIVDWVSDQEFRKFRERATDPHDGAKTYPINPDAFFRYQLSGYQRPHHFFLELDRRTESHPAFAPKVKGYIAYQRSGAFQKRFGFPKFRVLIVTITEENVRSLKRTTEAAGGERMFWFASLEALKRDRILEPIWEMATVEGKAALFQSGG